MPDKILVPNFYEKYFKGQYILVPHFDSGELRTGTDTIAKGKTRRGFAGKF
jgi:hypothetical protein